ncbi:suppressor of lurcher protein 1 [Ochlerotatus camptorhynchus]|uniref:suppressor of lurcher protein 1 n=1 Tax=Ochlerotatus camptorhynchus TaxID=644619 RepID=UPI0031D9071E
MMRQNHQLVKVTNFVLYLALVLPGGTLIGRKRQEGTVRAEASESSGKGTAAEFLPSGNSVASGNIVGSHGKGYYRGPSHCTRTVYGSGRIRNGSIAPSNSKHSGFFPSAICYQYEFIGEGAERIQIVFSEFRLPSKLEPNECGETDILMVFFNIGGRDEVVETLCGDILPKPILSNGARLLLEFRSSFNNTENKGFTADYHFLTNFGVSAGYQPNQMECSFHYFKNATSQGWIQSPNFPGAYPRNIRCNYYFHGDPLDYVLIRFTYFDIEGVAPCDEDSASDYVEFSNFITRDRKFLMYCGLRRDLIVRSDGRFFRVTMVSNDRLDGTGFRALYAFESTLNMIGPGSGPVGSGGNVGGVVGAAGVPFIPGHHYQPTTAATSSVTDRNVASVAKVTSGKRGGIMAAAGDRLEFHSSTLLLTGTTMWLLFASQPAMNLLLLLPALLLPPILVD